MDAWNQAGENSCKDSEEEGDEDLDEHLFRNFYKVKFIIVFKKRW